MKLTTTHNLSSLLSQAIFRQMQRQAKEKSPIPQKQLDNVPNQGTVVSERNSNFGERSTP